PPERRGRRHPGRPARPPSAAAPAGGLHRHDRPGAVAEPAAAAAQPAGRRPGRRPGTAVRGEPPAAAGTTGGPTRPRGAGPGAGLERDTHPQQPALTRRAAAAGPGGARLERVSEGGAERPDWGRVGAARAERDGDAGALERLAKLVGRHFRVEVKALRGASRRRQALWARQVTMYLAREVTGLPLAA